MRVENGKLVALGKNEINSIDFIENTEIKVIPSSFFESGKFKKIILPKTTKIIERDVFRFCDCLESIVLPGGLEEIGNMAFFNCVKLKQIEFPNSLSKIGEFAFHGCHQLKEVTIPDSIISLPSHAFSFCYNLESIRLPSTLKRVGKESFADCFDLKSIELPPSVTSIGEKAFFASGLEAINLTSNIHSIGHAAFYSTQLKQIHISVANLESYAFSHNDCLTSVTLDDNVECVGVGCFEKCSDLKEVVMGDSAISIGEKAFRQCSNLESIKLSKNLKRINSSMFEKCTSLERIEIPSSVEVIDRYAFDECCNLKEIILNEGLKEIFEYAFDSESLKSIKIPKSVRFIDNRAFYKPLDEIEIYNTTQLEYQYVKKITVINSNTGERRSIEVKAPFFANFITHSEGFCLYQSGIYYFFDSDDNWVELNENVLEVYNQRDNLSMRDDIKLYEWIKRGKFLPSPIVIENMPTKDIDNFYINKNAKRWKDLVLLSNLNDSYDIESLFKFAYVLGLFNEKGKVSQRAYDFIKNNVLEEVDDYHIRYHELNIEKNGYDEDFAMLVFKYFVEGEQNGGFLISSDDIDGTMNDYFSAVYNNFKEIKKAHPNRSVNTNRRVDMLTPEICIELVNTVSYENVDVGNEDFAFNIGKYGYSQEEFERAQKLFNIGKSISEPMITLVASKDDESNLISYELLEKDNPLGVILGNITNCCQTLNGVAKECVEYGLSECNSKFMVFRMNNKLIGQSWVWYDEITHCICLDNIEIPYNVMKNEMNNENVRNEFLGCLKRLVNGFIEAMEKRGLGIDRITIGKGYNDLESVLSKDLEVIENKQILSNYSGYSDAQKQYVLYKK